MTSPTSVPSPGAQTIALELAELRRSVDVGFATTRGDLALVLQRADQTDKVVEEHDARIREVENSALREADVAQLRADVEGLKRARWPLPSVAAVTGAAGLAVAVWQATGH